MSKGRRMDGRNASREAQVPSPEHRVDGNPLLVIYNCAQRLWRARHIHGHFL